MTTMTAPSFALGRAQSNDAATALHEAAHAVAYAHFGLDFEYLSVTEALVDVKPRPIDGMNHAVISMAGAAVEGLLAHDDRGSDVEVLEWLVDRGRESWEFRDLEGDYLEPEDMNDFMVCHRSMWRLALPFALALVTTHRALIERVAAAALASPDRLEYADFAQLLTGEERWLDETEHDRWVAAHNAVPVDLEAIAAGFLEGAR